MDGNGWWAAEHWGHGKIFFSAKDKTLRRRRRRETKWGKRPKTGGATNY
jgi:hypothetical protein